MKRCLAACTALLFFVTSSAFAEAPKLGWPITCTLGADCWIAQYVDHDPSPGYQDFGCGHRTYDTHEGTDIAVRDRKALDNNVPVVAAAAGKVARIRDNVEDHFGTPADIAAAKASHQEAGNVVSLIHDGGWVTEYAHMKKGSIAVKLGDIVRKGQRLGFVGQTGMAEFPHLDFSVRHLNKAVDPFTGENFSACGASQNPLWEKPLAYEPTTLFAAGFSDTEQSMKSILLDASSPPSLPENTQKFMFWVSFYGVEPGDEVTEEILDPAGKVYVQNREIRSSTQAKGLSLIGRRTSASPLQPGTYRGKATLVRQTPQGPVVRSIEQSVVVTP